MSDLKVLITAFGQYRQFTNNPSWRIAQLLPPEISHQYGAIKIQIVQPRESMKSEYHHILKEIPALITEHDPDIIIGIGQDEQARDFKIERGARRDVYYECPDNARKTLTKKETSTKIFGDVKKERLETGLELESVLERWRASCDAEKKGKGKAAKAVVPGMGISEDAGNFVCGLLYFAVLAELERRKRKDAQRDAKVEAVFLHVPPLRTEGGVGGWEGSGGGAGQGYRGSPSMIKYINVLL